MQNKVTVFSNGIADFVKSYPVKANETKIISIPVRQAHIGDILGSFNLFGDVNLKSPPSYASSENSKSLTIPNDNVWGSLVANLSGAAIEVVTNNGKNSTGTLVGSESVNLGDGGTEKYLVLNTATGLLKFNFKDIANIVFTDEKIKAEIAKALNRNLQKIKPDSTFIDFTVSAADKDVDAIVQYTIPSAAWKISYRVNQNKDEIALKGLAIVDNNTDEDWENAQISVVTGEPITFSTDLAQSKIPSRGHVNIVSDQVANAVEIRPMAKRAGLQNYANEIMACSASAAVCSLESFGGSAAPPMGFARSAMQTEAETKEIGDYCIYTTKNPVTIAANKSAVIPVFDAILRDAKTILHYDPKNNKERAYRSLSVINTTAHSLGRGICTIYQDGVYSGSCIFPATKPNQTQLLPYAMESGIRFEQKTETSNHTSRVSFKSGICCYSDVNQTVTSNQIENLKNEAFDVFVDYDIQNSNNKVVATFNGKQVKPTQLGTLLRYELKLAPLATVQLKIVENEILEETFEVVDQQDWTISNFFADGSLLSDKKKEFQKLFDLQGEIATLQKQRGKLSTQVSKTQQKSNRVRENLKAVSDVALRAPWETDLITTEKTITDLETQIQTIDDQVTGVEEKITKFLSDLTFEWSVDQA